MFCFVSYFNFQQLQKENEVKREEQNRNAIAIR